MMPLFQDQHFNLSFCPFFVVLITARDDNQCVHLCRSFQLNSTLFSFSSLPPFDFEIFLFCLLSWLICLDKKRKINNPPPNLVPKFLSLGESLNLRNFLLVIARPRGERGGGENEHLTCFSFSSEFENVRM